MASGQGSAGWWLVSLCAALPAAGLAAASGLAGLDSAAGLALGGAAVVYLLVDLLAVQPAIDGKYLGPAASPGALGRLFLQRALAVRTVEDVSIELDSAARKGLGIQRSLLVVPTPGGDGIRVLGGHPDDSAKVGDAEAAFQWLGDHGHPVDRAGLAALASFEGARATLELLDRLGGDVAMPLRHRGLLLGLVVLGPPSKPVDPGAQAELYRMLASHTTAAVANTYLHLEARARSRLSREFDLATAVQEALMPEDRPLRRGDVVLRGLCRPAEECGGDFWNFYDLGHGRVLLVIGDATGHGAAPAILTAVAKGSADAMRHVAGAELDPAQLLQSLNRAIYRVGRTRYMMSAFAAVLDSGKGEVRFANAGLNFPYVLTYHDDGRPKLEAMVARGNTLGSAPDAQYVTLRRPLRPGERMVLYTDGIIDAGTPFTEPFGEKRFRAALMALGDAPSTQVPDRLVAEVERFLNGRPCADDLTLVSAEIMPAEEGAL